MSSVRANDFDILIVGAGVSGSLVALSLSKCGLKVLCVEKDNKDTTRTIWVNEIPSNILRSDLLKGIEIPEAFTPEITAVMRPSGETAFYIDTRNYIKSVDMKRFVLNLRSEAENSGACISYNSEPVKIVPDGESIITKIKSGNNSFEVRTGYVIDCSGINSLLRKKFFKDEISESDYIYAFRYGFNAKKRDIIKFWNNHRLAHGAGMLKLAENGGFNTTAIYPDIKNETVEILSGGRDKVIKKRIKEIAKREFGIKGKPISGGGGIIPIRRPFMSLYKERIFRLGDSASMVYPMCASGVSTIIIATEILINSFKSGNPLLFEEKFNRVISTDYALMTFFRKIIEEADRDEASLLFDLVINPSSMKYVFNNRSVLNPELIIKTLKKGLRLIKRPILIPKSGIYLLAGGLDSVLYSLSSTRGLSERLSYLESRIFKLFMR